MWRPSVCDTQLFGFERTDLDSRFDEACGRLQVISVSALNGGYAGRSRGAEVSKVDGSRYWLKVFGVDCATNPLRIAEIASDGIRNVPKPRVVEQISWPDGATVWTGRLMTLADPAVAADPWAGTAAIRVTEEWLHELKEALDDLCGQRTSSGERPSHFVVSPQALQQWFRSEYAIENDFPLNDWRLSHNDLHWSNLTAPRLSILDWEWLGLSPVGYDAGMLIAYSCTSDDLVARLERVFAPHFETTTGYAARLFATHAIRNGARNEWLDPQLMPHLDRMMARLEGGLRTYANQNKNVGIDTLRARLA